jgi:hypothetical protein
MSARLGLRFARRVGARLCQRPQPILPAGRTDECGEGVYATLEPKRKRTACEDRAALVVKTVVAETLLQVAFGGRALLLSVTRTAVEVV